MKLEEVLERVGDEPLFETGFLLAGDIHPTDVHQSLSRWVRSGRLLQLRRGLYALAPPFQKVRPHPFLVANRLVPGSYVSLQSALAHFALIPESVPVTTSESPDEGHHHACPGTPEMRPAARPTDFVAAPANSLCALTGAGTALTRAGMALTRAGIALTGAGAALARAGTALVGAGADFARAGPALGGAMRALARADAALAGAGPEYRWRGLRP